MGFHSWAYLFPWQTVSQKQCFLQASVVGSLLQQTEHTQGAGINSTASKSLFWSAMRKCEAQVPGASTEILHLLHKHFHLDFGKVEFIPPHSHFIFPFHHILIILLKALWAGGLSTCIFQSVFFFSYSQLNHLKAASRKASGAGGRWESGEG